MAPKLITVPDDCVIYRGDRWAAKFNFTRDVSGQDFALQFKHSRLGDVVVEADIDVSHAADDPAYIVATIEGEDTAGIEPNLLSADLQASADETWLTFTIPVKGQNTEVSA